MQCDTAPVVQGMARLALGGVPVTRSNVTKKLKGASPSDRIFHAFLPLYPGSPHYAALHASSSRNREEKEHYAVRQFCEEKLEVDSS